MRKLLVLSILLFASTSGLSPAWGAGAYPQAGDAVLGVWATEGNDAHVEIYERDGKYHGKFVWFQDGPSGGGRDEKNPDPELRDRPLLGADFILNFEFDGNKWKNGRIYNPEDGKQYKADLELEDGVLKVRGWLGMRLIGRTVEWTRVR